MFQAMEELAMGLRAKRMRRGAIDFDFAESKVIVDEQGKPVDIVKRERSIAEQIIEEFMLAANETVAEHFHWLKVPFLYRIHEEPEGEKLMHFMQFAANFGYAVRGKGNSVHPRALQSLLEEIRGTKEETVISTMMLRSMKQAKYDAESLGHFGLAAEFYSHFTSPIRRYPDLVIHRVIREVLEAAAAGCRRRGTMRWRRACRTLPQQSSERERVAVDAERDTERLKKAEFMLDKIGEEFDGIISGVTGFGMFVELENTVEGLIRLSDLTDDYYHFHELHMALIGERTSRVFRIGDEVRIRVARVNMDEYTIEFEMVDMKPRGSRARWVDVREADAAGSNGRGRNGRKKKRGAAAPTREERAGLAAGRVRRRKGEASDGKRGAGKRKQRGSGGEAANVVAVIAKPEKSRKGAAAAAKAGKHAAKVDMWGLPVSGAGLKDDGGESEALVEMRKSRGNGRRKRKQ